MKKLLTSAGFAKRIFPWCLLLISWVLLVVISCQSPTVPETDILQDSKQQTGVYPPQIVGEYPENVGIYYSHYPGSEITLLDEHSLFTTQIYLRELDAQLAFFDLELSYDPNLMQFESIYSTRAIVQAEAESGILRVRSTESRIGPGSSLELCRITWKATVTSYSQIALRVNSMITSEGLSFIPPMYQSLLKVVKRIGTMSIRGDNYIEEGASFSQRIKLNTAEKNIIEYDININYDPKKLIPQADLPDAGITAGTSGFIDSINPYQGWIHISGSSESGTGIGTELEFLNFNWTALDTGRTGISVTINKMVTEDNMYIKPAARGNTVTIYIDDNSPIVDVWFNPDTVTVPLDGQFMTTITLNTTGYTLATYGIFIYYDETVLAVDADQANGNGIEAGNDGFLTAYNSYDPGVIMVTGFSINGTAEDPELELLNVYWKAIGPSPESKITMVVDELSDNRSRRIQHVRISDCTVLVPAPDTTPGTGQITLSTLPYQPYLPDQVFYIQAHLNTGSQCLAALSLNFDYNPGLLEFISAEFPSNFNATATTSGESLLIQGEIFEKSLPSTSLHLANLKFRALFPVDDYMLSLNINEFSDNTTTPIGNPEGVITPIRIIDARFGDVNEDLVVNIVDALIVAQAYVGLTTLYVDEIVADVNNDEKVTIVDALLIAQYNINLIDQFPIETYAPDPVPAIPTY